jgi:SAM-dependent methyltransferase
VFHPSVSEREYVLGTHDAEVERLGLQHRVWRPHVLRAWREAGFTIGQTLIDVGSGPGYATIDLAEIAGPGGRVLALERSERFLETLRRRAHGLHPVEPVEIDLDTDPLPPVHAHGAWVRWVFAFLRQPRAVVEQLRDRLRPRGVLVVHEYFDYATWRLAPQSDVFEEFVRTVIRSWRDSGGEPDIGRVLPIWLQDLGFELLSLRPLIDIVRPADFVFQWPKTFIDAGVERLTSLGYLTPQRGAEVRSAFAAAEADPRTLVFNPAVLEIIARKT